MFPVVPFHFLFDSENTASVCACSSSVPSDRSVKFEADGSSVPQAFEDLDLDNVAIGGDVT